MDAKSLKTTFPNPSGQVLLFCLAVVTLGTGLLLDGLTGRLGQWQGFFGPLLVSAIATTIAGSALIPWLQRLKAGQVIREDGPQAHLKKAGTPTMGGIFFVPTAIAIALAWSRFDPEVTAVAAMT
ncbi:MAG: phospho-N-acetylmuramoyl-pentapeptide-transferase, partial [Cyanobacteria bacterium J06641_5]